MGKWAKIGWPTAFLMVASSLVIQESGYVHPDSCKLFNWDYRWILRSADFLLIPLTFAMTMEVWPSLGRDKLAISFSANEREPPVWCAWECAFPSLLVGCSFCWFIMAFCWFFCQHTTSLVFAAVGLISMGLGVWISSHLRGSRPTEEEEDCIVEDMVEAASQPPNLILPNNLSAESHHKPAKPSYDPEDNVLAFMAAPKPALADSPSESLPPENGEALMVRGKSLGAFDCPELMESTT